MYNRLLLLPEQRAALDRAIEVLRAAAAHQFAPRDLDILCVRLERYWSDLYTPLERLYGTQHDPQALIEQLLPRLVAAAAARPDVLWQLDLEREITPDWFQQQQQVGGIFYVDLFADTLAGVGEHIDYLGDLGLTYVHLMPLLQPRSGANDGGYAVLDYRAVDPRLGTVDDLRRLIDQLRQAGMSVCLDVVVNHTAREHAWAEAAYAGDPTYQDYYLLFADRTLPDAYEATLLEVFPDFAPGNFTWYPELQRWVWTTFNEFQWDLNYANPAVWADMLDVLLFLANLGVEILRLDAVPFMWKRLGTISQNQPEVLDILQAWRAAMRIVCPATICKAEAIVAPDELVQYLGVGRYAGKVCELAYHNSLMVLLWSALASRKASLLTHSLMHMPPKPYSTAWITYVRCHDDIGWAVTDANAEAVGETGPPHRHFLSDWYAGEFPGSWARGVVFQYNPLTGDRRISGMTASLAGLEAALEQDDWLQIELSIRRILLLYGIIFAYNGIPLIYMGDELGLLNDPSYLHDPAKAADNRWLHRPPMNWGIAAQRQQQHTIPGRIWRGMQHLIQTRKATPALHSAGEASPLWTQNEHVFGLIRSHGQSRLLVLANMTELHQSVASAVTWQAGLRGEIVDLLAAPHTHVSFHQRIELAPYQVLWLMGSQ